MTSKNLFFNLLKSDYRRRLWCTALSTLALFFALPVAVLMMLQNLGNYSDQAETAMPQMSRALSTTISTVAQNPFVIIITMGAAVVIGLSGFFYLHSRKKVDLFHSLPVKRGILFAAQYVSGILLFLVPYLINLLISLMIAGANGALTAQVWFAALSALLMNMAHFLLMYSLAVLATVLTGNLVVAFLGVIVFCAFFPAAAGILNGYQSVYFTTYAGFGGLEELLLHWSPISNYVYHWQDFVTKIESFQLCSGALWALLGGVVFCAVACLLYRKRPSEAAGKALAFRVSRPIIKFALVILTGLAGGLFFMTLGYDGARDIWLVFGIVCVTLIAHCVIEIIYDFDFKSILHHKLHLAICMVAVLAVAAVYRFDLIGFDRYQPAESSVASMAIEIPELSSHKNGNYSSGAQEQRLNKMELTDTEAAYRIAATCISLTMEEKNQGTPPEYVEYADYGSVTVRYRMKSGRTVNRSYYVDLNRLGNDLDTLYVQPEYQNGTEPLYDIDVTDIAMVDYENEIGMTGMMDHLSKQQWEELVSTYLEERRGLTLDAARNSCPIGLLYVWNSESAQKAEDRMGSNWKEKGISYYTASAPVYASFTKTVALLEEYGVEAEGIFHFSDIQEITVTGYFDESYIYDEPLADEKFAETVEVALPVKLHYTDLAQMEALMEEAVPESMPFVPVMRIDPWVEAEVVLYNGETYTYRFLEGKIPQFIRNDLQYDKYVSAEG